MKTYTDLVHAYAALATAAGLVETPPPTWPAVSGPTALLFSPHPDDECITGALPLKLRKRGWRVVNVAVTLGSDAALQATRLAELDAACRYMGWENIQPQGNDLAAVIQKYAPALILCPHVKDAHPRHIETHDQVMAAAQSFTGAIVHTEYWQELDAPNAQVALSSEELGWLVSALALHKSQVARNPYHLTLPAWMIDNKRRAAERVSGFGSAASSDVFVTLYQVVRGALPELA